VISLATGLHKESKCELQDRSQCGCVCRNGQVFCFLVERISSPLCFRIAKCGTDQQNTACLPQLHWPKTAYPFLHSKKALGLSFSVALQCQSQSETVTLGSM